MSIIIGILVLVMFGFMQLSNRRQEVSTEQALGMKKVQALFLFLLETMIVLFSGFLVGTCLGFFFIQLIVIFITRGTQIPSYEIIIPWNFIIIIDGLLFCLAFCSALIPTYYISKQDIAHSFIQT